VPYQIHKEELERIISARFSKRIPKITVPVKGEKLALLKLSELNAKQYLEAQGDKQLLEEARLLSSLKELQRVLGMEQLPARMECFDISNIQGKHAVGSMVVFDFAKPKKDAYRKFKIQKKQTPDDFAMMREMLERRFRRSLQPTTDNLQPTWPLPDLIIIDGGKGQLSTAVSVLKQFKLNIPIIGLAKRLEEIFLPEKKDPIILPPNSIALFLLQRIRDEAHRFAVTYHRKLRAKASTKSALDNIPGIGPAKKKILLQRFGSAAALRSASLTDLSNTVGKNLAEKIKASL
jgi:excinuclease ABC subunit C